LNKYRTHNCAELTINNIGKQTILSGWIHKKRDHGNLLFIDLRDHYGMTQCVIDNKNEHFSSLEKIKLETVIRIEGKLLQELQRQLIKNLQQVLLKF
jgi:aspartyl-tRNA synthetase